MSDTGRPQTGAYPEITRQRDNSSRPPLRRRTIDYLDQGAIDYRDHSQFLPIEIDKYVMLLDWTGRELRRDKRGAIPDDLAPILDRLGVERTKAGRKNKLSKFSDPV
jgi:hypothetical protein